LSRPRVLIYRPIDDTGASHAELAAAGCDVIIPPASAERTKIVELARDADALLGATFRGMPGLRSKAFTVDEATNEATNFYVWDSEEAARAFFDEELRQRVTGLYGVPPSIRFVQIAELVDNAR